MGQTPTDEELFQMINDVDDNASGSIGMFFFSLSLLSLYFVLWIDTGIRFANRLYRVSQGCRETERKNS
jgi:hypothetical protein